MKRNRLTGLSAGAFAGLENLTGIDLDSNTIKVISSILAVSYERGTPVGPSILPAARCAPSLSRSLSLSLSPSLPLSLSLARSLARSLFFQTSMLSGRNALVLQTPPRTRGWLQRRVQGNSNSHGARPIHQIISMIKWIQTSRLSIKKSLSPEPRQGGLSSVVSRSAVGGS